VARREEAKKLETKRGRFERSRVFDSNEGPPERLRFRNLRQNKRVNERYIKTKGKKA